MYSYSLLSDIGSDLRCELWEDEDGNRLTSSELFKFARLNYEDIEPVSPIELWEADREFEFSNPSCVGPGTEVGSKSNSLPSYDVPTSRTCSTDAERDTRAKAEHFAELPSLPSYVIRKSNGEPSDLERSNCRAEEPRDGQTEFCTVLPNLPSDIIRQIARRFEWIDLWATSRVCKAWSEGLETLRRAMFFVHEGKKQMRLAMEEDGVIKCSNIDMALNLFMKGAVQGCAVAMFHAGELLTEMGKTEEGTIWIKQAAELGNPSGQYKLGAAYLLQEPSTLASRVEAAKWFNRAALAGNQSAQYSLAMCFHHPRLGFSRDTVGAAYWYIRGAETWYAEQLEGGRSPPKYDHGSVKCNAWRELANPKASTNAVMMFLWKKCKWSSCADCDYCHVFIARAAFLATRKFTMEQKLWFVLKEPFHEDEKNWDYDYFPWLGNKVKITKSRKWEKIINGVLSFFSTKKN